MVAAEGGPPLWLGNCFPPRNPVPYSGTVVGEQSRDRTQRQRPANRTSLEPKWLRIFYIFRSCDLAISWQGMGEPQGRTHPHATALFRKGAKGGSKKNKKKSHQAAAHTTKKRLTGQPRKNPHTCPWAEPEPKSMSSTGVTR